MPSHWDWLPPATVDFVPSRSTQLIGGYHVRCASSANPSALLTVVRDVSEHTGTAGGRRPRNFCWHGPPCVSVWQREGAFYFLPTKSGRSSASAVGTTSRTFCIFKPTRSLSQPGRHWATIEWRRVTTSLRGS